MIEMSERRKHALIQGTIACLLLSIVVFSLACQGDPKQTTRAQAAGAPTLFPGVQGLYESCPPKDGTRCLDRLKQMAAGGFTLVVNYDQLRGSAQQQIGYAAQAHALGMKVIWAMNNSVFWDGTDLVSHYKELAATCNCSDNEGFIRYVVRLVKDLPATWGYYIGDEVKSSNHDKLKAFTDLVHETDSSHPRLFVGDADSAKDEAAYLTTFTDTAEVIADDYYPVSVSSLTIAGIADRAKAVQSVADKYGKKPTMVLQAFSMAEYPGQSGVCSPFPECAHFPTKDEMIQMRDLVLQNSHPAFLLWYSYFDVLRSDNPSGHWKDLIDAASTRPKASIETCSDLFQGE